MIHWMMRRSSALTHIYLIRHGDYDEHVDGQSVDNPGLSPGGVRQAELLRDRLARTGEITADAHYASPARRAHETATILAPVLGAPTILDGELEVWRCDNGALSPEEFTARWQQVSDAQRPFFRWVDGGESWVEFVTRATGSQSHLAGA
jgi:probable phosphoglycerate mutase